MLRRDRPDEFLYILAAIALGAWSYGWTFGEPDGWDFHKRDAEVFRIVTWNVGSSSGEAGAALREEHLEAVTESLRKLEADVILLQEVASQQQVDRITDSLRDTAHYARFRGFTSRDGNRQLAVISRFRSRRSVHPIVSRGFRPALYAEVRFDDERIVILNVHADAYSSSARNNDLGRAAEILEHSTEDYAILAGDFNLDLDLDKRRDLFSDDEYRDVETYNYLCQRLQDLTVGTGSTAEPDRRLDYILASKDGWEAESAGPWHGQRVGDMDHHPVVADLVFD